MDYIKKTLYDARVEIVKKMVNPPTESIFLKEG